MKTATAGTSLAALGMLLLAACGGGGGSIGGGAGPNPGPTPPGPNPTPPGPARGITALPGIDRIPVSQIKATNSRMKDMFVLASQSDPNNNRHTTNVREVACNSYTLQCDDSDSFHGKHRNADRTITATTGSAPYTGISDNYVYDHNWTWLNSQMDSMPNLRIVSHSTSLANGRVATGATLPGFLVVQAAGNQGVNQNRNPLDGLQQPMAGRVTSAIAADKMILVAGWSRDGNGNFVRHSQSRSCRGAGVSEGCLWSQFSFPGSVPVRATAPPRSLRRWHPSSRCFRTRSTGSSRNSLRRAPEGPVMASRYCSPHTAVSASRTSPAWGA